MPSKDQAIGAAILVGCIIGIIVYFWLVFLVKPYWIRVLVLEITAFIAVGAILGIGAWIGWTMATTPPPKPIEEIEKELEEESAEEKTEEKKEEKAGEEEKSKEKSEK